MAVHPAYAAQFAGFAPKGVTTPRQMQEWGTEQVKQALRASRNLGCTAMPTFSGALLWHTMYPWPQRPAGLVETDIPIPNINCRNCMLQVIQFMAEHAKNADGDYSYHHCAVVNITADTTKAIDNRWPAARK